MFCLNKGMVIVCVIVAVIGGYYYGNKVSRISMDDGKWYKLVSSSGVTISVKSNSQEVALSLTSGERDLLVGYVLDHVFEASFVKNESDVLITVYDKDGDGEPDYRLIRDRKTGKVIKEYPVIQWISGNSE